MQTTGFAGTAHLALRPGPGPAPEHDAIIPPMKLLSYFRSSAAFRVRIALNLKGLAWDYAPVHLVRNEHLAPDYVSRVPTRLVPALELDDGTVLEQSLAIIEYLEEAHPAPALLPADPVERARVRALAQTVACEIHPLNNLRVLRYLVNELGADEAAKTRWYHHWVRSGLEAFERQLARAPGGPCCWGATPTLADCALVPQIFNAQRFEVPLEGLPRTMAAFEACMALPAFQQAQPSACPDAE